MWGCLLPGLFGWCGRADCFIEFWWTERKLYGQRSNLWTKSHGNINKLPSFVLEPCARSYRRGGLWLAVEPHCYTCLAVTTSLVGQSDGGCWLLISNSPDSTYGYIGNPCTSYSHPHPRHALFQFFATIAHHRQVEWTQSKPSEVGARHSVHINSRQCITIPSQSKVIGRIATIPGPHLFIHTYIHVLGIGTSCRGM